jgi:predicted phosphodiesterase
MSRITEQEFLDSWNKYQSAAAVARDLDVDLRWVYRRRKQLEQKIGSTLASSDFRSPTFTIREHSPRVNCELENGTILVASDAHYWPGVVSTAHQAFLEIAGELKPEIIVMNGDMFDGSSISRFPKAGWGTTPNVKQELEAVQERLDEIRLVAKGSELWWTMGNHDQRFEARLAQNVPEYAGVAGFTLKDHFPHWNFTMSLMVNENLMIKHRFRNGVHATWNNTLYGGISVCTGHLHRLQATLLTDYRGTRWGIDTGTLAEVDGDHMHYGEDEPKNHCSGFAVLTIVDGELIYPEFCSVHNEKAFFRGERIV